MYEKFSTNTVDGKVKKLDCSCSFICFSPALENAFRGGDVEDRGVVDAGQVQYIVQQVLGDVLTISEVRTLVQKAEAVGAASEFSSSFLCCFISLSLSFIEKSVIMPI